MRHISESIIGRRGGDYKSSKISGDLYPRQDLEYGDIVVPDGTDTYYMCLPVKQCIGWWDKNDKSTVQTILVRYSSTSIHRVCFSRNFMRNFKFVGYISEYRNIKTPEDLKRIFDKYNIPY